MSPFVHVRQLPVCTVVPPSSLVCRQLTPISPSPYLSVPFARLCVCVCCKQWARGFVGRLMADPAFIQKLVFEQVMAFSASMFYEWRVRGDKFKQVGCLLCLYRHLYLCVGRQQ